MNTTTHPHDTITAEASRRATARQNHARLLRECDRIASRRRLVVIALAVAAVEVGVVVGVLMYF